MRRWCVSFAIAGGLLAAVVAGLAQGNIRRSTTTTEEQLAAVEQKLEPLAEGRAAVEELKSARAMRMRLNELVVSIKGRQIVPSKLLAAVRESAEQAGVVIESVAWQRSTVLITLAQSTPEGRSSFIAACDRHLRLKNFEVVEGAGEDGVERFAIKARWTWGDV
jgi:hypothetical protein